MSGESSALAARRGSEERFCGAVEAMFDGFSICSAVRGEAGRIVDFCYEYVNDAAWRRNGLTCEQLLGRRIGECFPAFLDDELAQAQRRATGTHEGRPWAL
jgi:PAS domain-containing protein